MRSSHERPPPPSLLLPLLDRPYDADRKSSRGGWISCGSDAVERNLAVAGGGNLETAAGAARSMRGHPPTLSTDGDNQLGPIYQISLSKARRSG